MSPRERERAASAYLFCSNWRDTRSFMHLIFLSLSLSLVIGQHGVLPPPPAPGSKEDEWSLGVVWRVTLIGRGRGFSGFSAELL